MNRNLTAVFICLLTSLSLQPALANDTSFIQRSGSQLYFNNEIFRFAGANIYWLGLDENVRDESGRTLTHPSQYRIDNALRTAHDMGANVVRTFAVLSVGCDLCIQPALGEFNEGAFESFDFALKQAREYGIRFILPLVDNYHYYHGGRLNYTDWRGLPGDAFYTDRAVIEDYKNHIAFVLNHVNPYTGLAYKDDPTIMAWETGNELQSESEWAYTSWTQEIAHYIKSLAPNQLVADGRSALSAYDTHLDVFALALPMVDIVSGHYYPLVADFMMQDVEKARVAGKVFFVGEYDWTDTSGQRALATIVQDETDQATRIDITRASSIQHHVQFSYAPLQLMEGQTYDLHFEAKSSVDREIVLVLQSASPPFTEYIKQTVAITTDWQNHSFQFDSPVSSTHVLLSVNLAGVEGQVWLDNFSLSDNILHNASFTQSSDNSMAGWNFSVIGDPDILALSDFLTTIEATPAIAGDLYWALFGHDDNFGYVHHNQNYALYYPGKADTAPRVQQLREHAYRMRNLEIPLYPVPDKPLLHPLGYDANGVLLKWRGVVGASTYVIERSADHGLSWLVIAAAVSDRALPYTDAGIALDRTYQYRVKAVNPSGAEGQYSASVSTAELWENGSFEYRNQDWLWPAQFSIGGTAQARIQPATGHVGRSAVLVDITERGAQGSDIQLRQANLPLQAGQRYTFSFWAKASAAQSIEVVMSGSNRWSRTYDLTTDWREYTLDFKASETEQAATLAFYVGLSTGKVWFDGVSLMRVNTDGSLVNR